MVWEWLFPIWLQEEDESRGGGFRFDKILHWALQTAHAEKVYTESYHKDLVPTLCNIHTYFVGSHSHRFLGNSHLFGRTVITHDTIIKSDGTEFSLDTGEVSCSGTGRIGNLSVGIVRLKYVEDKKSILMRNGGYCTDDTYKLLHSEIFVFYICLSNWRHPLLQKRPKHISLNQHIAPHTLKIRGYSEMFCAYCGRYDDVFVGLIACYQQRIFTSLDFHISW